MSEAASLGERIRRLRTLRALRREWTNPVAEDYFELAANNFRLNWDRPPAEEDMRGLIAEYFNGLRYSLTVVAKEFPPEQTVAVAFCDLPFSAISVIHRQRLVIHVGAKQLWCSAIGLLANGIAPGFLVFVKSRMALARWGAE